MQWAVCRRLHAFDDLFHTVWLRLQRPQLRATSRGSNGSIFARGASWLIERRLHALFKNAFSTNLRMALHRSPAILRGGAGRLAAMGAARAGSLAFPWGTGIHCCCCDRIKCKVSLASTFSKRHGA